MRNDAVADPTQKLDLLRRGLRGTLVAIALFVAVGTVTAVWANPFFTRMSPVGPWELLATSLLAALSGVTTAFWVPQCRMPSMRQQAYAGHKASLLVVRVLGEARVSQNP